MRKTELEDQWDSMAQEAAGHVRSGYLLRRASADCGADLYAGLKCPEGDRALVLHAPAGIIPERNSLPETRGLHVFSARLGIEGEGRESLVVQLRDKAFEDTFAAFAAILINRACARSTPTEAVGELLAQLLRWQQFLDARSDGLGEEAQRGLYGELHVLRNLLIATGMQHLAGGWVGPSGVAQDFRFRGGTALEVKTSVAREPQSVRINGERQLDDTNIACLFLVSLSIERLPGSGETLPQLVASIRTSLEHHPVELQVFDEALIEASYFDTHRERYSDFGFVIRNERSFQVRPGFPRIVEADLPEGVGQIDYRVSLSACAGFARPFAEIVADVMESTGR